MELNHIAVPDLHAHVTRKHFLKSGKPFSVFLISRKKIRRLFIRILKKTFDCGFTQNHSVLISGEQEEPLVMVDKKSWWRRLGERFKIN